MDARINRAGVLVMRGDCSAAQRDVDAGLALDPDNAHLHCLLGQLHAESGRAAEAEAAYVCALNHDPALPAAWTGRATLAYAGGDPGTAVAH